MTVPVLVVDEPDAAVHRAAFLRDQPMEAAAIRAKGEKRRDKKKAKDQDGLFPDTEGVDDAEGAGTTEGNA